MRLHHTKHAGSLMSHGPPKSSHFHEKLPDGGLDHVDILMTAAAPTKNSVFGAALVEFETATFGRPAPVHGIT